MFVAIVEGRDHAVLKQLIESVRIGVVGRVFVIPLAGAVNQPAIATGIAFGPPSVSDAQMRDAVDRRFHSAGTAGLEWFPRIVQPQVATLDDEVGDM